MSLAVRACQPCSPLTPLTLHIAGDRLPLWLALLDVLKLPNQGDGAAFQSLGTETMKKFNEDVQDDPTVKYYSWGATFDPGLLDTFRWPHSWVPRSVARAADAAEAAWNAA